MGKSEIDINGFRRQTANPVSMVGVFPYTGKQIDYDGSMGLEPKKVYWVFRPPEELFDEKAIESFDGLPIKLGHVMLGKDFKAVDESPVDGCIYNVRRSLDMPEYLIAEFCIYTDKVKDVLEKGKIKELSLGYRCQYVPCVGSYHGKPYEFKQVKLRGNHLALVEHGRCGSSVCVCDKALITFDSLPEEMKDMNKIKTDDKGIERVKKLAEAVKNGDEQACQDCLDFYDMTPEQRKEALAFVKGKKDSSKETKEAAVEDAKAKDGEVPPPPPPPPPAEETPPAENTGATPSETAEEASSKSVVEPQEENAPVTDAKKKGSKCVKDCGVTEPSIPAVKQNLEGAVTPADKDGEAQTADNAHEQESTEVVETAVVKDKGCKKSATKDAVCKDCGKTEDKGGCCSKCGKPLTKDEEQIAQPESDVPSKMGAEEGEQDIKKNEKIAQDQYKEFAAEFAKAQNLAHKVRPFMKETFDSSLMREVDVARYAAKHIPELAFASDAADGEVLAAVRGLIAHADYGKTAGKAKEFVMDEALPKVVKTESKNTVKALSAFLNS